MKHINKVLRNNDLTDIFIYDKGSKRGFPTKDSIGINILYTITDTGAIRYQYSLKVPGDMYIQRVGNSITYRKFKSEKLIIPISENIKYCEQILSENKYLYSIFEDIYLYESFNKSYKERIYNLLSRYMVDIFSYPNSLEEC